MITKILLTKFANHYKTTIFRLFNVENPTIIKYLNQIWNDLWFKVLKLKQLQNILNKKFGAIRK